MRGLFEKLLPLIFNVPNNCKGFSFHFSEWTMTDKCFHNMRFWKWMMVVGNGNDVIKLFSHFHLKTKNNRFWRHVRYIHMSLLTRKVSKLVSCVHHQIMNKTRLITPSIEANVQRYELVMFTTAKWLFESWCNGKHTRQKCTFVLVEKRKKKQEQVMTL